MRKSYLLFVVISLIILAVIAEAISIDPARIIKEITTNNK
jgi:hypothetical protein